MTLFRIGLLLVGLALTVAGVLMEPPFSTFVVVVGGILLLANVAMGIRWALDRAHRRHDEK